MKEENPMKSEASIRCSVLDEREWPMSGWRAFGLYLYIVLLAALAAAVAAGLAIAPHWLWPS
jgi:hypothetical protein